MIGRWRLLAGIAVLVLAMGNASAEQGPRCGGPLKGWLTPKDKLVHSHGGSVQISLRNDGTIFWNGLRVNHQEFASLLKRAAGEEVRAIALLEPDDHVNCTTLAAIRTQMNKALRCSSDGYCGEGRGFSY